MTGRELAAVQELGTTPEALAARTVEMDRIARETKAVSSRDMAAGADDGKSDPYSALECCENCDEFKLDVRASKDGDVMLCDDCAKALAPNPRKPRSDKGVPRIKAAAAAAAPAPEQGKLSSTQASRLLDLIASAESRRVEWDAAQAHASKAQERMHDADAELLAFIRENTQS